VRGVCLLAALPVLLYTVERPTSAALYWGETNQCCSCTVERGAVRHVDPSATPHSWLPGQSFFILRFYVLQGTPKGAQV
jgi:hypothetical protein